MKNKIIILAIGFFLGFVFTRPSVPVSGFNTVAQVFEALPNRIIIPSVSIDIPVKKALIVRGYWQVFNDSAAWGDQSGIPGRPGNQVIFAHTRAGLFLPLHDVKVGEKVYVTTNDGWFAYEVKEIKTVLPSQIDVVAPTTDETLTLYTCTDFNDSKRLIVIAKRI